MESWERKERGLSSRNPRFKGPKAIGRFLNQHHENSTTRASSMLRTKRSLYTIMIYSLSNNEILRNNQRQRGIHYLPKINREGSLISRFHCEPGKGSIKYFNFHLFVIELLYCPTTILLQGKQQLF